MIAVMSIKKKILSLEKECFASLVLFRASSTTLFMENDKLSLDKMFVFTLFRSRFTKGSTSVYLKVDITIKANVKITPQVKPKRIM